MPYESVYTIALRNLRQKANDLFKQGQTFVQQNPTPASYIQRQAQPIIQNVQRSVSQYNPIQTYQQNIQARNNFIQSIPQMPQIALQKVGQYQPQVANQIIQRFEPTYNAAAQKIQQIQNVAENRPMMITPFSGLLPKQMQVTPKQLMNVKLPGSEIPSTRFGQAISNAVPALQVPSMVQSTINMAGRFAGLQPTPVDIITVLTPVLGPKIASAAVRKFGSKTYEFLANKDLISDVVTGRATPEQLQQFQILNKMGKTAQAARTPGGINIQTTVLRKGPVWDFLRAMFPSDFTPTGQPKPTLNQKLINMPDVTREIQLRSAITQRQVPKGMMGGYIDPNAEITPVAQQLMETRKMLQQKWDTATGGMRVAIGKQLTKLTDQIGMEMNKVTSGNTQAVSQTPITKVDPTQLVKTDPILNMKRDVPVTDIHGQKTVIPQGEALTPYEIKGGKVLLKDGKEYLITKNQYENVKGQAVKAEAKPFSPELAQTEEVVNGYTPKIPITSLPENYTVSQYDSSGWWTVKDPNGWFITTKPTKEEATQMAIELLDIQSGASRRLPKYEKYTLPGGENYREVLVKAPEKPIFPELPDGYKIEKKDNGYMLVGKDGKYIMSKLFDSVEQLKLNFFGKKNVGFFKSSHWDEPNVITHLRFNNRTTPDGKKVTFMEELQSDWAREGRSKGFTKEITKESAKQDGFIVKKSKTNLGTEAYFIDNKNDEYFYRKGFNSTGFNSEEDAWNSIINKLKENDKSIPNHPLLKNWQELAVKRALQEAVKDGSEYLSWTTGEQQKARYQLSKQIDEIKWNPDNKIDGNKQVTVLAKNGNGVFGAIIDKDGKIIGTWHNTPGDWMGKNINDVIGKGIGEKVLTQTNGSLSGEGLNIGGEWANTLYDKQVKNIVEDLTGGKVEEINLGINKQIVSYEQLSKQAKSIIDDLDNGKIEQSEAETALQKIGYQANFDMDGTPIEFIDLNKTDKQQAIKITPEIRSKILGEAPKLKQPSGVSPFEEKKKEIVSTPGAQQISVDQLISHEGAPDRERVEYYKEKIRNGEKIEPLLIGKEGDKFGIEDGKHRYQAIIEMGYKTAPVQFINRPKIPKGMIGGYIDPSAEITWPWSKKKMAFDKQKITDRYIKDNYNLDNEEKNIIKKWVDEYTGNEKWVGARLVNNDSFVSKFGNEYGMGRRVAKSEIYSLLDGYKDIGQAVTQPTEQIKPKIVQQQPTPVSVQNQPSYARSISQEKERKFIQTVRESPKTAPEVATGVQGTYEAITNKETMARAQSMVDKNIESARQQVKNEPLSADTSAIGQVLIDRYQKKGQFEAAIEIAETMAQKATDAGQAIQALSMWSRLTPEGALRFAQTLIKRANAKGAKIAMTSEKAKRITEIAKDIKGLKGEEKLLRTADLMAEFAGVVPSTLLQKISTIQTIAQLLNPKTAIRNLGGNLGFQAIENISRAVATPIDIATGAITGKRTTTLPSLKAQVQGFAQGLREGVRDALRGIDTSNIGTQFDLPKTTFEGPVGRAFEKALNLELRATDRAFFQSAYKESLDNQMRASGVTEPTKAMHEIARATALYRTFQDENLATKLFTGLKRGLNIGKEWGLGDLVLKYPKTPASLLMRGVDYSPAGFIKVAYEMAKPLFGKEFNQQEFVNNFARALVGTAGLLTTGAILYNLGIITGAPEKDYDIQGVQKAMGLGSYKINVSALKRFFLSGFDAEQTKAQSGDTLVNYDWIQPMAIGLSMGANIAQNNGKVEEGSLIDVLMNSIQGGMETLAEQPLVQGVQKLASGQGIMAALSQTLKGVPASFVPQILNQINQAIDNRTRMTYDPRWTKEAINMALAKIPGLSQRLPGKYTLWGDDMERYQGGTNSIFNVFFNPAFVTTLKSDAEGQEVLDIYRRSGEVQQAPRLVEKKIKVNGEDKILTPDEMNTYQLWVGKKTRFAYNTLLRDPKFTAMSDEEKATAMAKILTDINKAAKISLFGDVPKSIPTKIKAYMSENPTERATVKGTGAIPTYVTITDKNGKEKTIDTSWTPTRPTLTGLTELDSKLTAKYNGEITKKQNEIYDLFLAGKMTQAEANAELLKLKAQKLKVSTAKRGRKVALKKIKMPKLPKLKKIKIKKIKYTPISRINISALKVK